MRSPLRVGVIGCGVAGGFHLEAFAEETRANVVALAGLNTARCLELANQFGVPHHFDSYQALLRDTDIDAVSIAAPNHLHLPIAIAALSAGKHVLVEKPLARNAAEAQQMIDAARQANRVLAVSFNYRFRGDCTVLKQCIDDGQLGHIYHAKAFWLRRSGIPGLGSWFVSKELAGGGPLIDIGTHVLDMALWLLGDPKELTVSAATYSMIGSQGKGQWHADNSYQASSDTRFEVEDLATAFVRLEAATLQLDVAWAAYGSPGDEFGVTLMGSKGGARILVPRHSATDTLLVFTDIGNSPAYAVPQLPRRNGHTQVVRNFVDSILDGRPIHPSGEEGLKRVRLIDAIYRSAELGREVSIGD